MSREQTIQKKQHVRKINAAGLNLVKHFEGFFPEVYICPAGYPTVGYGHLLRKGEDFKKGLTEDEAASLLDKDLASAAQSVLRLIHVPLTDNQFSALVSFTFNLGGGALQRSTLRRKINRGEHEEVPSELKRWIWGGGRRLPGLLRRRIAEGVLYLKA